MVSDAETKPAKAPRTRKPKEKAPEVSLEDSAPSASVSPGLTPKMDTARLRAHVFEQTGIRIDTTDPVFALVALNDAVLADGIERQRAAVDDVAERLAATADELLEAGERYKRQVQRAGGMLTGAEGMAAAGPSLWQMLALGSGIAVVSAALTVAGMQLFAKPQVVQVPAPAAAGAAGGAGAEPAPLTAEQILHMQNGEKFVKIMPQLDAKTQARILELMRQP